MIYIGTGLLILAIILMGKAPGPAFLIAVVGLILVIVGIPRYAKKSKQRKRIKKADNKPVSNEKEQPERTYMSVSEMLGNAGLKYHYENVPIVVTDSAPILTAAQKDEWELSAARNGDEIILSTVDGVIGRMTERADMVSDWIRRKEPYQIILQNYNTETGEAVVFLAFYREGYNPLDDVDDGFYDDLEDFDEDFDDI